MVSFQGENDKSFGAEFVFNDHSKELIVGEIFVRVYNEQPTFPLEVSTGIRLHHIYSKLFHRLPFGISHLSAKRFLYGIKHSSIN